MNAFIRSPTHAGAVAHVLGRAERGELATLDLHEPDTRRRVLAAYVHRPVHTASSPCVLTLYSRDQRCAVEFATEFDGFLDEELRGRPGELTEEGRLGARGDLLQPLLVEVQLRLVLLERGEVDEHEGTLDRAA